MTEKETSPPIIHTVQPEPTTTIQYQQFQDTVTIMASPTISLQIQLPSPPPRKMQRTCSPTTDVDQEEMTEAGDAIKSYPLHEMYDLDDVVTNRICTFDAVIVKAY